MYQTSKYVMTPLYTLPRQEAIQRIYVFQLLLQNELHKSKFGLCQTLLNMIFFEIFLQLLSQISMKNSINKNLPIRRCSLNKNSNSPAINLNQSGAPILFTKIDSTKKWYHDVDLYQDWNFPSQLFCFWISDSGWIIFSSC